MERVEIQWTASGKPLRVRRAGRVWTVVVEPVCWFERVAWWKTELRAAKSDGSLPPTRIDTQIWQVQVTLGARNVEPITWELVEHPQTGGWGVSALESKVAKVRTEAKGVTELKGGHPV